MSKPSPYRKFTPTSAAPGTTTRLAAAQVLHAVMYQGRSLKAELAKAHPSLSDSRDRALLEATCMAVLRQHPRYEAALKQWLRKPLENKDKTLQALLLAGFAQLDALQLPPHAAVSATVETARAMGYNHQTGMINALLRRAQREGFPQVPDHALWPKWLKDKVITDWPQHADSIFAASLQPAPLWLRINQQKFNRDDYQLALQQIEIETQTSPLLDTALELTTPVPIASLPDFATGAASIQDGSAQQVANTLTLPPNARVLDACAAPGGKAAHLLERQPTLQLLALDIDPIRLERIQQTFTRLQLNATTKAADATKLDTWWDGKPFDAILLDAPCSATGIVRRQPDVLIHRRPQDITALKTLQAQLLDACWQTLKPGGLLIYTTCSILKEENEYQIDAFLARTPDAKPQPLNDDFGHLSGHGRQRLPGEANMDGFFYARLQKM